MDTIFNFAIIMSLIYCFVVLWKPFIYKQNIDYFGQVLVRAVEVNGEIDSSITDLEKKLKSELGINSNVIWSAKYISGSKKIQIRDKFTLTITDTIPIKILEPTFTSPLIINVPFKSELYGVSEVYWK